MCTHESLTTNRAASLADGKAHDTDHNTWTRRQFITGLGLATVGSAISISGTPVRALAGTPLLRRLMSLEGDRVVIMIQLSGGNDGLNTVVPAGGLACFDGTTL